MKLGELNRDLNENNIELVVFSYDSEGNNYSKLGGYELVNYQKTCSWSGNLNKTENTINALVLISSSKSKNELGAKDFIEKTKDLDPNLEVVISKYKGEGSPYDGFSKKYFFDNDDFNGPHTLYEDEFDYFIKYYEAKSEDFIPCLVLFPVN